MKNHLIPALVLYLRRFRFDLIAFWSVSFGLSWMLAAMDEPGQAFHRLKALELLLLVVVTARLVLAESVFKTAGGWKTRPLESSSIAWGRIVAFAIIIGLPALARMLVWKVKVSGSGFHDGGFLANDLGILALFAAVCFLLAHLVGKFIEREKRGMILLILVPLAVTGVLAWSMQARHPGFYGYDNHNGYGVPSGARAGFPEGTAFLGEAVGNPPGDGYVVKELFSIPLTVGAEGVGGDLRARVASVAGEDQLQVSLSEVLPEHKVMERHPDRFYLVRYADGSVAGELRLEIQRKELRSWLYRSRSVERFTTFPSPRNYPWNHATWDEVLKGAELIAMEVTGEPLPLPPNKAVPSNKTIGELTVRSALLSLHPQANGFNEGMVEEIIFSPEDVVAMLLEWPAWSNDAFDKLIRRVLERRTEERHRTALEKRFETDSRVSGILIAKGWGNGVVPTLIGRLKEGRPLRQEEIVAIAERKDPSDGAILTEAFLRLGGNNDAAAAALKSHPGVDWDAMVRRGWEQARTTGYDNPLRGWTFANWAARNGDVSALRRLAMEASKGKKWERQQLTEIVDSGGVDPVEWLRENHGAMRYDPVAKRFTTGN